MPSEVLKQLLSSEVLTEETKTSISSAFQTVLAEAKEAARAEVTEEVTANLTEDFVRDRDALVESVDALVTTALQEHIASHQADFEAFRDVEAEAARVVVEAKQKMVSRSKKDLKALVEKLDVFLDRAIDAEFSEIREELVESQRSALGLKIFEGFKSEFEQLYAHQTGIAGQLSRMKSQLSVTQLENKKLQESLSSATRAQALQTVLAPLTGKSRQVMETILSTVATERLQETYGRFVGRVIDERGGNTTQAHLQEGTVSEKENQVLAEQVKDPKFAVLKTGDEADKKRVRVNEGAQQTMHSDEKRRLMRQAGLI